MAISRQQIIQIADKLYNNGSVPTITNIKEAIALENQVAHLSDIALALKSWRLTRFENAPLVKELEHKHIVKLIDKELDLVREHMSQNLTRIIDKYIKHSLTALNATDNDIANLSEQTDELIRAQAQASKERDAALEGQRKLEAEINNLRLKNKEVSTQYNAIKDIPAKLTNEIEQHKKAYTELGQGRETMVRELSEAKTSLSSLKQEIQRANTQLEAKDQSYFTLQKELEDAKQARNRADVAAQKSEQSRIEVNKRVDTLTEEKQQYKTTLTTLEKKVQKLESALSDASQNAEVNKTRADSVQQERDRLINELKHAQQKNNQYETDLNGVKDELTRVRSKQDTDKANKRIEQNTIASLEQQIRSLKQHYEEMNKIRLSIENSNARLSEEITALKQRFSEKQQLWMKEKRTMQEKLENERRHVNEMGIELTKSRRHMS